MNYYDVYTRFPVSFTKAKDQGHHDSWKSPQLGSQRGHAHLGFYRPPKVHRRRPGACQNERLHQVHDHIHPLRCHDSCDGECNSIAVFRMGDESAGSSKPTQHCIFCIHLQTLAFYFESGFLLSDFDFFERSFVQSDDVDVSPSQLKAAIFLLIIFLFSSTK